MMSFKITPKIVPPITKAVTFLVVFWILYLLIGSLWQNWNLKHSIWKLNDQIATLETQKKDLENLNLYYRSDSFKELEARKRLGLKKPGEKVFILPSTSTPAVEPTNFPSELNKEKEAVAGVSTASKIPNWLLWWQYLTK